MQLCLTAADDDDGRRLDRILRKALRDMPLSAIHRLLRKGAVRLDGNVAEAACRVHSGQTLAIDFGFSAQVCEDRITKVSKRKPAASFQDAARQTKAVMQNKPVLEILFEGAGLIILNKAAGLAVHGRDSLEDLVLSYLLPKQPFSLSFRPGPLHRLDRPSSGIIAFSTTLEGARLFSSMMKERMIKRKYLALVEGSIVKEEIWKDELFRDKLIKKTFLNRKYAAKTEVKNKVKKAITRIHPLL
jgi:23S rRNA pseudouridine955/2504/2580 synthase